MKKFECPFNQTSEYDDKCKNCSFQLMCTVKDNFPKLYGNVGSTNQTHSYPHSNDSNIPYADCCATSISYNKDPWKCRGARAEYDYLRDPDEDCSTSFYTGSNPTEYYYVTYRGGQVECDKMAYLKDSDDWFLKKTLKENKIKKFFKKVFRGYYIFK